MRAELNDVENREPTEKTEMNQKGPQKLVPWKDPYNGNTRMCFQAKDVFKDKLKKSFQT